MHIRGLKQLFLVSCLLLSPAFILEAKNASNDLLLEARSIPGLTIVPRPAWRVVIKTDGTGIQDILPPSGKTRRRELKLSKAFVQKLMTKVREIRFFELRKEYVNDGVTDLPGQSIEVWLEGHHHKVRVYAPDFLKDVNKRELDRFFELWTEILRQVPPPSPG